MSFSTSKFAVAAFALISLSGCEEPKSAGPPRAPKAPPARESPPVLAKLTAQGSAESRSGWKLDWSQAVSAGVVIDVAICSDFAVTVTADGRLVAWDLGKLVPTRVIAGFAGATAVSADDSRLLVGTADGRLLRASCTSTSPRASRNRGLPIRALAMDARAKNRAFIVFEEVPTTENKLSEPHLSAALVDYKTGNSLHRPFRVTTPLKAEPGLFVDYRGELWLSITEHPGSTRAWYMERFDKHQPPIEGLDGTAVHGFAQISRHVWAYGGSGDGPVIARVDTGRAKPMLVGAEAWFGAPPGGEVATGPIRALSMIGGHIIMVGGDQAFRADPELRRWSRIPSADDGARITAPVTDPVVHGDEMVVGTPDGLVAISRTNWRRGTVEPAPDPPVLPEPEREEVKWQAEILRTSKRGLLRQRSATAKARVVRGGPRGRTDILFVDQSRRLWVFGPDRLYVMQGTKRGQTHGFDSRELGLSSEVIEGIDASGQGVVIWTSYGALITLAVAEGKDD